MHGAPATVAWRPDAGSIALLTAGLAIFIAGLWALWLTRRGADEDGCVRVPVFGVIGVPTCLTIGFCLLIGGYHAAVYALPRTMTWLAVPVERSWLLAVVIAVALIGSVLAEALERSHRG